MLFHRRLRCLACLFGLFNQALMLNEKVALFRLELCIPESDETVQHNGLGPSSITDGGAGRGSYQVRGLCLTMKQFFALLIKRLHHTTRSYKDFFAQVTFNAAPFLVIEAWGVFF